jgi:two-component system, chemotaxis family, chemotaxis protein CheY
MTKILVADDSGTMRKIIIRTLNGLGIKDVSEAADGEEALVHFQRGGYDLVLTDWNMPNKTGLELVRDIRQTDTAVPVVMVTTEGEKRRVVEAIQAGISDYLLKPFTADDLKEKLEKFNV